MACFIVTPNSCAISGVQPASSTASVSRLPMRCITSSRLPAGYSMTLMAGRWAGRPARSSRSPTTGVEVSVMPTIVALAPHHARRLRRDCCQAWTICEGCRSCPNRDGASRFLVRLQGFVLMRGRPPTVAMIGLVFVVVPLWSGGATGVGSIRQTESPRGSGGVNPAIPVADRTVLSTSSHRHPTSRHYKTVQHTNKQTQQYYQPARQYYQWHEH
jgi:hypothetical protein